ncbi:hypothetical protein CEY12_06295 [Chryseobacterium sp. T16E-39]|uniref:hypothetical protein n=1 Tax=Chryseobacterium sp. T16E-39 TaxID=2015076 RepID=UPI000B5B1E54|nr:hypothetical protein [Chryseobacterium sp. T16E-39]ASK29739.1 hypothetical protein CEY12_06295 [Chryseobacterium sp. T16E-39]
MTSKEYIEYDRLTYEMELHFIALTPTFMGYCEDIIFGNELPGIKYYCFHFYNDKYLSHIYQKLTARIERLFKQIDSEQFPDLSHGFANLLIYLKEPIVRENDQEYRQLNYDHWREVVIRDEVLIRNGSFRKYINIL